MNTNQNMIKIDNNVSVYYWMYHYRKPFVNNKVIVSSNKNRRHYLPPLFSFFLCTSKSFQTPLESTIYRPSFLYLFSAVPNRYKYRQNALFTVLVFILFSAFPNRFKYHQNALFTVLVFILFSALQNRFKYR